MARFADRIRDARIAERKAIVVVLVLSLAFVICVIVAIGQASVESGQGSSSGGQMAQTTQLVYDGNGGTSGGESVIVAADLPNNVTMRVDDQGFTRSGYAFKGWSTSRDATEVQFAVGDYIRVDATNQEDNVLFAVWEPV